MKLDTKQKILLTLIIIALAYVIWQVYTMFAPSKTSSAVPVITTPAASVNNSVQTENPSTAKPMTGVPATSLRAAPNLTPNQTIPSAPPMRMLTISAPLSPTQAEYLRLLNRYQIVRMKRMVLDEEAQIATSQAKIAELNEQTAKFNGTSLPSSINMTQPVSSISLGYELVYVDYQSGQWTATLNIGGELVQVNAGTRLSDGARIVKIDQRGVVIRRAGTNYLLNFYGTTRLTTSGVAAAVTMPNNYSAPVANIPQKSFAPAKRSTPAPAKKQSVIIACPPSKPCEPVKPNSTNLLSPAPATITPVTNPNSTLAPNNTKKELTIIPNNPPAPAVIQKQEENKTTIIKPIQNNSVPAIPTQNFKTNVPSQSLNRHEEKSFSTTNHSTVASAEAKPTLEKNSRDEKASRETRELHKENQSPNSAQEKQTVVLPVVKLNEEKSKQNEPAKEIAKVNEPIKTIVINRHEEIKRPAETITLPASSEKDKSQLKLVREESKPIAQPLIVAASTPKETLPPSINNHEATKLNEPSNYKITTKVIPAQAVQSELSKPTIPLALTAAQKDKVVQLETMLAVKPTVSDATEGKVDDQHILSLPADHYTIQLMASARLSELANFSKTHHLDNNAYIYHTFYLGKNWYVLVYGVYLSEQDALKALPTLPVASSHSKPWVRSIASIHAAIKREQTDKNMANDNNSNNNTNNSAGPVLRIN